MDSKTWPEQDHKWVARYRTTIAGKHVPAAALEERERELLNAVREAGLPAAELFGDAALLATEDVAELASVDEAVRTSEGGGLRSALREVGGTLVGTASVAVLIMLFRSGWSVDVDVGSALVFASLAVVVLSWIVGRALLSAGRPVAMVGVLIASGIVAVAGIASAASLRPDLVAASDVPVPLLGVGLLAPGVLALVAASRMPQQTLREDWDDAEWLRRFRGGLRSRLVPATTARGHAAEIEQAMGPGAPSAFDEFGHPLVLARELGEADRTARARRWWVSTVVGPGTYVLIAVAVLALNSWGALTIPLGLALLLGAVITLVLGWGKRPWAEGP